MKNLHSLYFILSEHKEEQAKGKRQSIPLDVKIQALDRLDKGERQVDIGADLHLTTSTIRTILKNKDKIRTSATTSTASSAKKITRSRSYALEEIYAHIQSQDPDVMESFAASRGWFDRFKKRYNLYNLKITGEAASAVTGAAAAFTASLKDVVDTGSYPPEIIFNVDETGLFWKRMPSRTFISREQKRAPGFKASKDRLTLLLGGNANGDFRIKPLLVYHSQTPRAMRGISKSSLPVIWKANRKAWITRDIFTEWFTDHFCPSVQRYCRRKGLEEKVLLIMDNALSHPTNLAELPTYIPVEVLFLPPNTTSLIQPMDQEKSEHASRTGELHVGIHTNNGLERQNEVLKHTYLEGYKNCTLGELITVLHCNFSPNVYKKYVQMNSQSSELYRRCKEDVPAFFKNRPRECVSHVMHRMSSSLTEADITNVNYTAGLFKVKSKVTKISRIYC
ncbi:tigger transposable element-derived 1-like [Pelobates cultripes]|uniref:Tigger transposable element-derived 1-like n=1 Tax=Pelobates cultripes TaxID=61616 RepID=A0AAD1VUF3_PELCU|nr:tigger transposable element-derived 1-like [Pelobates cultripes]